MNKLLPLALVFVASSCATMNIQKDRVSTVKRVAIIGYQGVLQLDDNKGGPAGGIKGAIDMMGGKMNTRREEQAATGYGLLAGKLGQTFNWEVVDPNAVAAVPLYAEQNTRISPRTGTQYIRGILNQYEASRLSPADMGQLANQLGVDALVTIDVRYQVGKRGGFSMGGMGSTTQYPVAVAHLRVYDPAGVVMWEDWNARGAVTTEGLRNTMGADIVENETAVLNEAASTSFDALIARYQQPQQ